MLINFISSSALDLTVELLLKLYDNKKIVYKSQINDEHTFLELIKFLEQHNFPAECFDFNCPVSKCFASYTEIMTPDLTVIDPDTMQPLVFFKTYMSEEDFKNDNLYDAAYHLNKHSNSLFLVPYYIVINNTGDLQFYNIRSMLKFGKKFESQIAMSEPMKYNILQFNCHHRIAHNKIIDRNKLQNLGKFAFLIIVPLIAIVIIILDALKIYELSNLRLIVYGIVIVSFLIPYLTQITIKDVSLTFKEKSKQKTNKIDHN